MEFAVIGIWAAKSVAWLVMSVGIVLRGKPVMFSLQPSGPQEGRLSDEEGRISEFTCSS